MRNLQIDVNCKYSSTGKIVYSLYNFLKHKGEEIAICYGRGDKIIEDGIFKFGIDAETVLHAAISRITGKNGYYSPLSTRRLINYIETYKPDLIHIHELHAYFVNSIVLLEYLKKKGIPIIWTFHCEYMYTGKCGYSYSCNKWETGCEKCPRVKDYPKSLWFDRTKEMFYKKKKILEDFNFTIVSPSEWLAERIRRSFLSEKEILVINNGIDTKNTFYPRKVSDLTIKNIQSQNKKIVLSVAPDIMDERKDGKTILEISESMKDVQFILIGADETKQYSDNVLLIQRTKNQNELAEWYSSADVFLICSSMENFPTTCLESLACGTPIVGFDSGGTAETAAYPFGRFVEYGNLDALKASLREINTTQEFRKEIRKYAQKKYDLNIMSEHYYELYLKKLKQNGEESWLAQNNG